MTDLIIVGFKVPLFPTCHNCSYQRAYFNLLLCKLLRYCSTQLRAVVKWSTTEWNHFIGV